jgi:hypothetical protein
MEKKKNAQVKETSRASTTAARDGICSAILARQSILLIRVFGRSSTSCRLVGRERNANCRSIQNDPNLFRFQGFYRIFVTESQLLLIIDVTAHRPSIFLSLVLNSRDS